MGSSYGHRVFQAVAALSQMRAAPTLGDVASAMDAPVSSAQRALQALAADGLIASTGRPPRYRLQPSHPASAALIEYALRSLPIQTAVDTVLRANPAVQFAGIDAHGVLVVLSPFADAADVVLLQDAVVRINRERADTITVEYMEREQVQDSLYEDLALRRRGLGLRAIVGSAIRTFRNPHEHGSFDAPLLGRLHPSLARVSRRELQSLAKEHGLVGLKVFGSAVREDFRPDSDVDIAIEPAPDKRMRLADLISIREKLENVLDRDVDLVNVRAANDDVAQRIAQEGVTLYGRS